MIRVLPVGIYAIEGTSMYPTLHHGDLVFAIKTGSVNPGDIIVFQQGAGKVFVHRVISGDGETFYTRGDNNRVPDPESVTRDRIIGRVCLRIRFLGYPRLFFRRFFT
jgi:signal peptidase I